ncbi:hypothetical protein [Cupriavidus pampae]|uniref:hypothetical protein n=1 Tax=Cupriavidus pampae TaxID=659251 RepID=UPI001CC3A2E6|nr:hypothetical protein [Cupriavidus pampae]
MPYNSLSSKESIHSSLWMPPLSSALRCDEPQSRLELNAETALIALADNNEKVQSRIEEQERREKIINAVVISLTAIINPEKELEDSNQAAIWSIIHGILGIETPDILEYQFSEKAKKDEKINELFSELERQRASDDAEMDSGRDRLDVPNSDVLHSSPLLP